MRLHTEIACRRGGALARRSRDLDPEQCLVLLREKGDTGRSAAALAEAPQVDVAVLVADGQGSAAWHPDGQSGCMPALYYRGPSEPGGDDDIIAEVADRKLRRRIEISDGAAHCTGYADYPVTIDMSAVAGYVWPIPEQEFNDAWLRYCS